MIYGLFVFVIGNKGNRFISASRANAPTWRKAWLWGKTLVERKGQSLCVVFVKVNYDYTAASMTTQIYVLNTPDQKQIMFVLSLEMLSLNSLSRHTVRQLRHQGIWQDMLVLKQHCNKWRCSFFTGVIRQCFLIWGTHSTTLSIRYRPSVSRTWDLCMECFHHNVKLSAQYITHQSYI